MACKGKLVRDKLAPILQGKGRRVRRADPEEFLDLLLDKIVEEAIELRESPSLEEIADLYEALDRLIELLGFTWHDVFRVAKDKRLRRGGFRDGWVLCFE